MTRRPISLPLSAAALGLTLLAAAGCAHRPAAAPEPAGCLNAEQTREMAARIARRDALERFDPAMTLPAAQCTGAKLQQALVASQGRVVGYKAGLTNPAMQKRFGLDGPVIGSLHEKMLRPQGTAWPAQFGARPFAEADLLLEVGREGLERAATPAEALGYLRAVVPFIELPDLMVADPSTLTGPAVVAINVGARGGVLGQRLPLDSSFGWEEALRTMTVRAVDGAGTPLDSAKGDVVMGGPLHVAVWVAQQLARQGVRLKPGDLISVGSFSKSLPVKAGGSVVVHYDGLPGNPQVAVRFE